jgi:hypothetical protein
MEQVEYGKAIVKDLDDVLPVSIIGLSQLKNLLI